MFRFTKFEKFNLNFTIRNKIRLAKRQFVRILSLNKRDNHRIIIPAIM